MSSGRRYDVVLLDALGTIVDLEPPWPHLVDALAARGARVDEDDARRAMVAEMTYYRANCDTASDRGRLADLRRRCAAIVADELGASVAALSPQEVHDAMLESLRFPPFPEVPAVLAALRAAGATLVVVSNWDISLHEVLARTGLDVLVDGAVTSAELGAAKPDPLLLRHALRLAGDVSAARAVMVGDGPQDVEAAQRAGCAAVLVDRHGVASAGDGVTVMPDLRALPALVGTGDPYPVQDA
jgi:HAD superfamily hydrolase (TIGR01509 family)